MLWQSSFILFKLYNFYIDLHRIKRNPILWRSCSLWNVESNQHVFNNSFSTVISSPLHTEVKFRQRLLHNIPLSCQWCAIALEGTSKTLGDSTGLILHCNYLSFYSCVTIYPGMKCYCVPWRYSVSWANGSLHKHIQIKSSLSMSWLQYDISSSHRICISGSF